MFHRKFLCLTVLCAIAALSAMPSEGRACWPFDCLFGASAAPAPAACTTYAPPYQPGVPACSSCTPSCSSCVTVAPSCSTCVPQTCEMPVVTYRPLFPAAVAYQPVVSAYPVTTYRPLLGIYQTRMVPYTTYRMVTPAVAYPSYSCYSPCTSCSACPSCRTPCASCSPCTGCSSCAGGACGVSTYDTAPTSGCSSCGVSTTSQPTTYGSSSPAVTGDSAATQKTFEQTNRPAPSPESPAPTPSTNLKPIPANTITPSSGTMPSLIDPNDRTAASRSSSSVRVQLTSQTTGRKAPEYPDYPDGNWMTPKD